LGLGPASLSLAATQESIEHLGQVSTFRLDLESRWRAESHLRRLDFVRARTILDIEATFAVELSVVWAYLTLPSLRTMWEGPLVIEETLSGGRRGVGTIAQCVSDRLATLEEVVDWQPYEHVGWRLAIPSIGHVVFTRRSEARR
jgi:hypothetical protein